jgi:hypothetical protein
MLVCLSKLIEKYMENQKQEWTWVGEANLSLENSFGTLARQSGIKIEFTLGIHESGNTGWFEFYDIDSGGEKWYAEGGLWFDGKDVMDFDGVFELPEEIMTKLNELGYDCSNVW